MATANRKHTNVDECAKNMNDNSGDKAKVSNTPTDFCGNIAIKMLNTSGNVHGDSLNDTLVINHISNLKTTIFSEEIVPQSSKSFHPTITVSKTGKLSAPRVFGNSSKLCQV